MAQVTELDVFALCLGGNVFGWALRDEAESFAVLDDYANAGGNFVDTADVYSAFVPGNSGGESETILGQWMRARGNRDRIVIATKVGQLGTRPGLTAANVRAAAEDSLRRLQTDRIDLYYAHRDDSETPLEETHGAFDELVREGKLRHVTASNYSAERLAEALSISEREGFASYVALEPPYSLVNRDTFEGTLQDLCVDRGIAVFPYSSLASGFLTGKYRSDDGAVDSVRAERVGQSYMNERGFAALAALDDVAGAHGVPVSAVALAWVRAQPGVVAPIASATTPGQLAELLSFVALELTPAELERLAAATAA
jgi:aryl-alcohol dehydrogenase-like predicted oxidoreductase